MLSRFSVMRPSMARAFASSNFKKITSFEQYLTEVKTQADDKLVVAYFNAEFSTWGKVHAPSFEELSKNYPQHTFLSVDIDATPRAAYHAEVTSVPTVVVMNRDDAQRSSIKPEVFEASDLLTRAKAAIDTFKYDPEAIGQSTWDHHIRKDNLHAVDLGISSPNQF